MGLSSQRRAIALAALGLTVIVVSFPAWTGSWIYDDWLMAKNPKMDDIHDLLQAFSRSSSDYLGWTPGREVAGSTYRPLSMSSLTAVQVLFGPVSVAHHLLSLLMHLGCVFLLVRSAALRCGWGLGLALGTLFALHPIGIEAWGWINGRSDLVLCLGAALLTTALERERPSLVLATLGAVLAVFSKETGSILCLGLVLAYAIPTARSRDARPRPSLGACAALVIGVIVAEQLARRAVLPPQHGGVVALLRLETDLALTWTRMLALAVEALIPAPRTMQNLGVALAQPMAPAGAIGLALLLGGLGWALVRRRFRTAWLIALAGGLILPSIFVRHAFWLGFDRYLYVPLFLLCLAVSHADCQGWLERRLAALSPAVPAVVFASLTLWLSWGAFGTAQSYASQADFMAALIEQRPADPSGALMGARWLLSAQRADEARQLAERIPRQGLPPGVGRQAVIQLGNLGRPAEGLAVFDDLLKRHAADPYVRFDGVGIRLGERRIAEALELARSLSSAGPLCRGLPGLFAEERAAGAWTPAQQQELDRFLAALRCH